MTTEEGFREIQLNGKQLVFLFMAATVVSVVIFLCGVLVGRGVRADRPTAPDLAGAAVAPDPGAAQTPAAAAPPTQGPAAEPPAPADELTYFDRLQKSEAPLETLKSVSAAPPPVSETVRQVAAVPPTRAPQPSTAEIHPAAAAAAEPTGQGFAVQVAAYWERREADTLAKRLVG